MFSAFSTFKSAIRELRHDLPSLLNTNYLLLVALTILNCYMMLKGIDSQKIDFIYSCCILASGILGIMLMVRVVQAKISTNGYQVIGWYGISWTWRETRLLLSVLLQVFMFVALLIPIVFIVGLIAKNVFSDSMLSYVDVFPKYLLFIGAGIFLIGFVTFYFIRTFFNIVLAPAMYPKPLRSAFRLTRHHKIYILKVQSIYVLTLIVLLVLLLLFLSIIYLFLMIINVMPDTIFFESLSLLIYAPINIILSIFSTYLICGMFTNISASDPEMQKQVREGFN